LTGAITGANVAHVRNVRQDCIDEFASAFVRYGMTLTIGRVFGLLVTADDPIGLDDIARDLSMSKSAASRTIRDLEHIGIVRRASTPGSRRIVFSVDQAADRILDASMARIKEFRDLFASSAAKLGKAPAAKRLQAMGEMYEHIGVEIDRIRAQWEADQ
jgi:DNA-binding transcriptional regulator GbsR (MarR family)